MDGIAIATHSEHPIHAGAVLRLYQLEGWWPSRTEAQVAKVLDTAPAVGAWDGDQLVGFARVITDGLFHAYLEDVVVEGQYRRRGVGAALVTHLLEEIRETHVVTLFCKQGLAPFYERQGFRATRQVVLHRDP